MEYKAIFSLKTGQYNTIEDNNLCIIKDEVLLLNRMTQHIFDINDIKNMDITERLFRYSHVFIDKRLNRIYINEPQVVKIPNNKCMSDKKKVTEAFDTDFQLGKNLRDALQNIVSDFCLLLGKESEWFILLTEKAIVNFYTNNGFYTERFNDGYRKKEERNKVDVLDEFHKMINNQDNTFTEICDKIKFN